MDTKKSLGVGIIGASVERGWAKISHVPAMQTLAGLELAAVASGSKAKGEAAAMMLGALAGFQLPQKTLGEEGFRSVVRRAGKPTRDVRRRRRDERR